MKYITSLFAVCAFIFISNSIADAQPENGGTANVSSESSSTNESTPKKSTYSDRYKEQFNTSNYKERNNSKNYRETMIQEGRRHRNERNNGDRSIRFDYVQQGAIMSPPLRETTGNTFVELDPENNENSMLYHSGQGMRLHIPNRQSRESNLERQERVRSIMSAPSLFQRFVHSPAVINASQINTSQAVQNNHVNNNRFIPPVNQTNLQNDLPPQTSLHINQQQFRQNRSQPPQQYQRGKSQRSNRIHPSRNSNQSNKPVFLPFPYSNVSKRMNANSRFNTTNVNNTRDPRLHSRYQQINQDMNVQTPAKDNVSEK